MAEIGIDISGQRPKPLSPFIGQHIAYAITLCDRETESGCPIYPGVVWRFTWPLPDPHRIDEPMERLDAVRQVRDAPRHLLVEFVSKQASA